ncbi:MAG: transglycosylase domain-containing protein [Spirochaetaceae bacterium]|nr:transglycosylase domain-containing protein [Spirochaetaceae bacterium]
MKAKSLDETTEKSGLLNKLFQKKPVRVLIFVPVSLLLLFFIIVLLLKVLPFSQLKKFENRQYSTRFYDRNGILLSVMSLEDGVRREWTPLKEIPLEIRDVFIKAEDRNFYSHHGVDSGAVFRALTQNVTNKRTVSGASTITMQLARLVVPRKKPQATIKDKITEAVNAIRIELKLNKDRILELYLNNIPFGYRTEGITSAARNFYACSIHSLTTEQIETLALIPRRPASYIELVPSTQAYDYPTETPHFIIWVCNQYKEKKQLIPPDVYLSIDSKLTNDAANSIAREVSRYSRARVSDGAAFAINNKTGEIILWCGSTSFEKEGTGQIDGVLVRNQAGSSMKPFLYAYSIENGFPPNTVLPDIPSDFGTEQVYVPQNFNNRFNGPQLMRTCLASSLNVPAVYLLYHIGVDSYFQLLQKLGFASLKNDRENLGLSLALGAGEVKLYELVRGFSVFSRDGTLPVLTFEKTAASFAAPEADTIYKNDTARIICDILSDKNARSLGFGFAKVFDTPYPAIFKTGTSNQFQNIIALGSTKTYTVGVWMGNVTGETVIGETGSSIPAGIVRKILDTLESENPAPSSEIKFEKPELYRKQKICALSGKIATKDCPATTEEFILKGQKLESCDWHKIKNGQLEVNYPDEYQRWIGSKNINAALNYQGKLRFAYPQDRSVFLFDTNMPKQKQQLRIDVTGGSEDEATLYVDSQSLGTSRRPFSWYMPVEPGTHTLVVQTKTESDRITIEVR